MKNRNADTRARDIDTPSDLAQWWNPPIMSVAFKAGETCAAWNGEVLRFASDRLRQDSEFGFALAKCRSWTEAGRQRPRKIISRRAAACFGCRPTWALTSRRRVLKEPSGPLSSMLLGESDRPRFARAMAEITKELAELTFDAQAHQRDSAVRLDQIARRRWGL
jgi:hypothetical protein